MEIGGDFWKEEIENKNNINKDFFEFGNDNYFVMSGRSAIDVALQDILTKKKIRNVYFPSYSCESMQQPFINRNIKIDFYNVYFDDTLKYDIDIDFSCDIFFAMNYFGYTSSNMEKYIQEFKKRNVIVIEDITHSLLSKKVFCKQSDYLVCSLRKWFPIICGGLVSKVNGKLNIDYNSFTLNNEVINNKKHAMQLKYELQRLKKKIYQDKFYCPSHWPTDNEINDLFEQELSIVCDQRYTKEEIEKEFKRLNEYL